MDFTGQTVPSNVENVQIQQSVTRGMVLVLLDAKDTGMPLSVTVTNRAVMQTYKQIINF